MEGSAELVVHVQGKTDRPNDRERSLPERAAMPDQHFLNNICEKLLQFSDLDVVIGGDFNASIHPQLDRSSSSNPSIAMSTSSLNRFITELNLIDPWRIHNPYTKGYTFYSPRHKSFQELIISWLVPLSLHSAIVP
uniref:Endonuclease/exonuclease/phosphatase domain-containing protein n=1 Tax=Cyprinus carpio TaxID=7962 RepID=A0A8C1RIC7_CYPCA